MYVDVTINSIHFYKKTLRYIKKRPKLDEHKKPPMD